MNYFKTAGNGLLYIFGFFVIIVCIILFFYLGLLPAMVLAWLSYHLFGLFPSLYFQLSGIDGSFGATEPSIWLCIQLYLISIPWVLVLTLPFWFIGKIIEFFQGFKIERVK